MFSAMTWLGRAVCAAVVCSALVSTASAASADSFGSGANQFDIEFVTIDGSTNPTSGYGIVNNDYRIGVYEVTNDQWDKFKAELGVPVTGKDGLPEQVKGKGHTRPADSAYDKAPSLTGPNEPTNNVSWYEAAQFVNWLNTEAGHQPAYKFTGTQGTSDYALATWDPADADGTNLYRHKDAFYYLPTEDEWVKAGYWNGTNLQTYSNASPDDLDSGDPDPEKWNYYPSVGDEPWDVGTGVEELNGTYDMMGNVQEWMESPYNAGNYGTHFNNHQRGLRGGSCRSDGAPYLASSDRGDYNRSSRAKVSGSVSPPKSLSCRCRWRCPRD